MADGSPWPAISIVTPSFNQARFLEATIRSVLLQGYPSLEYFVVDGKSTDGSVDIVKKYAPWLSRWTSESDRGQVDAINKGLRAAKGEWLGWQNSDDIYYPGALAGLARAAARNPLAELIIADANLIDVQGAVVQMLKYVRPTHNALLAEGMVLTNQAAFWRRRVHDDIGWLDEELHYSFDYEWFLRLTWERKTAHVGEVWGATRLHDETKTSTAPEKLREEHARVLAGRRPPRWRTWLYRIRRALLTLLRGEITYVVRGAWRRCIHGG